MSDPRSRASSSSPPPSSGTRRLDLPAFSEAGLVGGASVHDGRISVHLIGTADLAVKPRLDAFLGALHAEARRLAVAEVQVDLRRLEFMNSSCIKAFTSWLLTIDEQAPADRYLVRFVSSGAHWQARSLEALRYFAPDVVRLPPAR